MKQTLNNEDICDLARATAHQIRTHFGTTPRVIHAYPIPRGGVPAAYAISRFFGASQNLEMVIVDKPEDADLYIDDIIDTGSTMEKMAMKYGEKPFFCLVNKMSTISGNGPLVKSPWKDKWVVFPWEGDAVGSIQDNVIRLLEYIGEDTKRGGLKDTPRRVIKAWDEWTSGYKVKEADIIKLFEDGASERDEMVVVKDIPFYSHCEHHLAPFFGTATVAYIPKGRIVGLSKIPRLIDVYAKRLQVQERLTNQIADALEVHLGPLGVGVLVKARHLCMESRGINKQGHHTVTNALRGVIRTRPEARAEFMAIAREP